VISISETIIRPFAEHSESFAKSVFNLFAPFCHKMFGVMVLLWFVIFLYNVVVICKLDLKDLFKKVIIFCIVGTALNSQKNFYWEYVYEPLKLSSVHLAGAIISVAPKATRERITNNEQMLKTFENVTWEMMQLLFEVCSKAGFLSGILAAGISICIMIVFLMTLSLFALYLAAMMLDLTAISAISPFLILTCAFDATRSHALAAIKLVINSILILMIAALCMGLMLFVVKNVLSATNPANVSELDMISSLSTMGVTACFSIFFLLCAPKIAGGITGSPSSSTLPGIMGATMAGGLGFMASKSGQTVWGGTKAVGSGMWQATRKVAKAADIYTGGSLSDLRNRFKKNYAS
jgi:type IV secretory pathway VirB6-like protein